MGRQVVLRGVQFAQVSLHRMRVHLEVVAKEPGKELLLQIEVHTRGDAFERGALEEIDSGHPVVRGALYRAVVDLDLAQRTIGPHPNALALRSHADTILFGHERDGRSRSALAMRA